MCNILHKNANVDGNVELHVSPCFITIDIDSIRQCLLIKLATIYALLNIGLPQWFHMLEKFLNAIYRLVPAVTAQYAYKVKCQYILWQSFRQFNKIISKENIKIHLNRPSVTTLLSLCYAATVLRAQQEFRSKEITVQY